MNNLLPTVNIRWLVFFLRENMEVYFMTNEQIVEKIRNGYSVTENMQLLYENNLPLIKRYIMKYSAYHLLNLHTIITVHLDYI